MWRFPLFSLWFVVFGGNKHGKPKGPNPSLVCRLSCLLVFWALAGMAIAEGRDVDTWLSLSLCSLQRFFFPTQALSSCGNSLACFGIVISLDVPRGPESSWPKPNWVSLLLVIILSFLPSQGSSAHMVSVHVAFPSLRKVNPIWMFCGISGEFVKMCLGLNVEGASMLRAKGRNECRVQRVTKSGKSGLMAQVIAANRRLDKTTRRECDAMQPEQLSGFLRWVWPEVF